MINRRIFDLKKLEKIKAEETARFSGVEGQAVHIVRQESVDLKDLYPSNPLDLNNWLLLSDFVLSPNLLTDLGIPRNIETPPDTQSSF